MSSKIIFLGTAGDASVFGRQLRASGGIVLQVEDLQFHIDPGPGTLVKAKEFGVNLRATTAILVSTNHVNQCNDMNAIIEAMTLAGLDRKGVAIGAKSVISGGFLTPFHKSLIERAIPLDHGQKVGIEVVEIHAVSIESDDKSAVGFKFYCPRFTLGYIPNTKYNKKLVDDLSGSDILIVTIPIPENKEHGLVLDTAAAAKLIQKVRPRLAVITNFGLEMLKADPILIARDVQRETGVQTIAAKDGLIINPDSYSAKSPQYRLASFYK